MNKSVLWYLQKDSISVNIGPDEVKQEVLRPC
jgi:hypothetical protein